MRYGAVFALEHQGDQIEVKEVQEMCCYCYQDCSGCPDKNVCFELTDKGGERWLKKQQ